MKFKIAYYKDGQDTELALEMSSWIVEGNKRQILTDLKNRMAKLKKVSPRLVYKNEYAGIVSYNSYNYIIEKIRN